MRDYIQSLELINFRSYARIKLIFENRPVVITGQNGAGKTNLLEAVSLFTAGRGLRRAASDEFANSKANVGWKLRLNAHRKGVDFEIENGAPIGEPRQVRINGKSSNQTAQGEWLRVVWMVPSMDRLWIDSASERRKFFDRLVLSFVPTHGENVVQYEKSLRERNRMLKDGVQDSQWFESVERQMARFAEIIVRNRTLACEALNLEMQNTQTSFPSAALKLEYAQEICLEEEWLALWADTRRQDQYAGITRLGPHKLNLEAIYTEKNQPASLCSTGEQKALLISLILANARALIQQGVFVVVLLDEVVAHLDQARRLVLFDEICDLDAHVLMTGTETDLFEGLGARATFIDVIDQNGFSETLALIK